MKTAYPVIFRKLDDGAYMAYVPDFEINTQGKDLPEAIGMARDAIGLMGVDMADDEKELPKPRDVKTLQPEEDEVVSLVDIDFTQYRKASERRTVRRNVTLPKWMDERAKKEGINVSAVLQKALEERLNSI